MSRHLLSSRDLNPDVLATLVRRTVAFASPATSVPSSFDRCLVALYFKRPSTRTRTAFDLAAKRLGAWTAVYGPDDMQVVTGESIADTARVLASFARVLVIRTNEPTNEMRQFAEAQDDMAVINALSAEEHPTQAIADLAALTEAFGSLNGLHVLYVGEGNNTCASLALSAALTPGLRLTVLTPEAYGLQDDVSLVISDLARDSGAFVTEVHMIEDIEADVDCVYTTRWEAMGVPKDDPEWRKAFAPYKVTASLLARVSSDGSPRFMHDLPAMRGCEVDDAILDGPDSLVLRQVFHKLTSAMAVLEWCAGA